MILGITLILIMSFAFVCLPILVFEDKFRVKCDELKDFYKEEYEIELEYRKSPIMFLLKDKDKVKKWKKYRKSVYKNTKV